MRERKRNDTHLRHQLHRFACQNISAQETGGRKALGDSRCSQ